MRECKFDRNEFDAFLGSATVVFDKPEDAKKAIAEYHGAYLDDKVLTVEEDVKHIIPKTKSGGITKGKTLRLGDREGLRRR